MTLIKSTIYVPNDTMFYIVRDKMPPTVKGYADRLETIPQGRYWHPEGDVLVHTKVVFNRALKYNDINLTLAAFFHDLGKVDTTKPNGFGGFSAHKHETVSADLVNYSAGILRTVGADPDLVHWIVLNHMRVKYLDEMKPKKRKDLMDHNWWPYLDKFKGCDNMRTLTWSEVEKAGGNGLRYLWNRYVWRQFNKR